MWAMPNTITAATTSSLIATTTWLMPAGELDADDQHAHHQQRDHHRGQVDDAVGGGRRARSAPRGRALDDLLEVAGEAGRQRRRADRELQGEVPADDPRDQLAEGRVAERVGAAGHRHRRGELRVAERRERAGEAGDRERDRDRRAGVGLAATVPVITKMPAPMMTPTPKTIRSRTPRFFLSRCSGSSVSAMDCSTDFVRKRLLIRATYPRAVLLASRSCGHRQPPHRTGRELVERTRCGEEPGGPEVSSGAGRRRTGDRRRAPSRPRRCRARWSGRRARCAPG